MSGNLTTTKVLLVGSGLMALEYAKVLDNLKITYDVVGRGKDSALEFSNKTGKPVFTGGVDVFFKTNPSHNYKYAIVTTGINFLCEVTTVLLENNIPQILVEKPGGLNTFEISKIHDLAAQKDAEVYIAYNRRFYSSTAKAKKIIEEDGGVSSFHFEFTEWAHTIEPLKTPMVVKNKWFLANSSHVVDLAFYLGGEPEELSAFRSGKLSWHSHSKYVGAGIANGGAVFSYHANWASPGRWSLEILTSKHRLYFKPMETLQIQVIGSVAVNAVEIDNSLDLNFKAGLFEQTRCFLENKNKNLCTISEQLGNMRWYDKISGYDAE